MLDPPGTIRTPSLAANCFTGYKSLSKNGCFAGSIDMSTIVPMRNPRTMPFFTQVLMRHPLGCEGSGSAARTRPAFNSSLNARNSRRSSSEYVAGFESYKVSICFSSNSAAICGMGPFQQRERFKHGANLYKIFNARRNQRKPPDRLQQTHF